MQIAPGTDPADKTFIDLDGPSLRVIDLRTMPGPPTAQLVAALKPYTATAAQIGQTFGVALDNDTPPNIYVAASSAYGLPIVARGPDGQLQHVAVGRPTAGFMPGLWGGGAPSGGPGSIWRIDGVTGAVTLFANVTSDSVPNSGPALGGLAFDAVSNSLFVADRETGLIHRFAMNGIELGRYDHGVNGRQARGMQPVPYDPAGRLDITSPKFDSTQATTFGYAVPDRRVFGLAVFRQRLYYAVAADEQVWSVGLQSDGSFGADAKMEIAVTSGSTPNEVSKIAFDDAGRMLLAERPMPSGAYTFEALTPQGIGRILRYANASGIWQQLPDEYAIGFPAALRNGNGGVAIGFNYDQSGEIDRASCGEFLWSSGEQLRAASDPTLREQLARGGPANVDGLQGNQIWLVRPSNTPPLKTYFIDYDDRFDDDAARGHLGDIAIWRNCSPALRGGWIMPDWMAAWTATFSLAPNLPTPPPSPNQSCLPSQSQPGYRCCPIGTTPDTNGQCEPWCKNSAQDPQSLRFCALGFDPTTYQPNNSSTLRCIGGSAPNAGLFGCVQYSPILNAPTCQAGWAKQTFSGIGSICAPTAQQLRCSPGQQVSTIDNQCHGLCLGTAWPMTQCCQAKSVLSGTGVCCPAGSTPNPETGQCSSSTTTPTCRRGEFQTSFGNCCTIGSVVSSTGVCCPAGSTPDPATGQCSSSTTTPTCRRGEFQTSFGNCCPIGSVVSSTGMCCPRGSTPDPATGQCSSSTTTPTCRRGEFLTSFGNCCNIGSVVSNTGTCCPRGSTPDPKTGKCTPPANNICSPGYVQTGTNTPDSVLGCCLATQVTSTGICCAAGQTPGGLNNSECLGVANGCTAPLVQVGNRCCSQTDLKPGGKCAACNAGTTQTCSVTQNSGGVYGVTCSCCPSRQVTATGECCPAGTKPGGPNNYLCEPPPPPPPIPNSCCTPGSIPTPDPSRVNGLQNRSSMICCPMANVTSNGVCCSEPVDPKNRRSCPAPQSENKEEEKKTCAQGYRAMPDGTCCNDRFVSPDGTKCSTAQTLCPPGQFRDTAGGCTPIAPGGCPPGEVRNADGVCVRMPTCAPGETSGPNGTCLCPPGQSFVNGRCAIGPTCPSGQTMIDGACRTATPCPAGEERNSDGVCRPVNPPKPSCPADEERNADGACVPTTKPNCPAGEVHTDRGCEKIQTPSNEPIAPRIEPEPKLPKLTPPPKVPLKSVPPKLNIPLKLPTDKKR